MYFLYADQKKGVRIVIENRARIENKGTVVIEEGTMIVGVGIVIGTMREIADMKGNVTEI